MLSSSLKGLLGLLYSISVLNFLNELKNTKKITAAERCFLSTLHSMGLKNRFSVKMSKMLLHHAFNKIGFTKAMGISIAVTESCEGTELETFRSA